MKNNGWWVFLSMMLAFVAPVRAEVNENLTAILSRVSFVASRELESFSSVSGAVPNLLSSADANVSMSDRFTSPAYNPSNLLSETGVSLSPNRPDIRHDRRDLRQDQKKLQANLEQYQDDVHAHKPITVIIRDLIKISNDRIDITADKKDLQQDRNGH